MCRYKISANQSESRTHTKTKTFSTMIAAASLMRSRCSHLPLSCLARSARRLKSSQSSTSTSVAWLESGGAGDYKNWMDGSFVKSHSTSHHFVKNPATHELIGKVPDTTATEIDAAVQSAHEAYEDWRWVPVQQRQRVMLNYQQLIRDNMNELAYWITLENGKTLADARGDVFRGLEVVETACNVADKLLGESLGGISRNMDCVSYKQPLGVCAGVGTSRMKWPESGHSFLSLMIFISSKQYQLRLTFLP